MPGGLQVSLHVSLQVSLCASRMVLFRESALQTIGRTCNWRGLSRMSPDRGDHRACFENLTR